MDVPTLETHIVLGAEGVASWARRHYFQGTKDSQCDCGERCGSRMACEYTNRKRRQGSDIPVSSEDDWWCVKAAGANGGMDVWVLHKGNWTAVAEHLHEKERYVVQVRLSSVQSRRLDQNAACLPRKHVSHTTDQSVLWCGS